VLIAHYTDDDGRRHVFLRSAIRPPVYFFDPARAHVAPRPNVGQLWEFPAGLVEAEERGVEGLRLAASRELLEEAGFEVEPAQFRELGSSMHPTPGVIAERLFFFEVAV